MRPKLNICLIIAVVCFSCQHENHYSIHNPAVDSLTRRLQMSDSVVETEKLEKWWMELSRYNNPQKN